MISPSLTHPFLPNFIRKQSKCNFIFSIINQFIEQINNKREKNGNLGGFCQKKKPLSRLLSFVI